MILPPIGSWYRYNIDNTGTEGGVPGTDPAFESGEDGFLASLETKGIMDATYDQALEFCQRTTGSRRCRAGHIRSRPGGISAVDAPSRNFGRHQDALWARALVQIDWAEAARSRI